MTAASAGRDHRPDWRCYVSEALGTFALVAIGPGAAMVAAKTGAFGHSGVALAFGLAVALIVAASGHLGGAHINPAVTLGFWSVRRFPARDVLPSSASTIPLSAGCRSMSPATTGRSGAGICLVVGGSWRLCPGA